MLYRVYISDSPILVGLISTLVIVLFGVFMNSLDNRMTKIENHFKVS